MFIPSIMYDVSGYVSLINTLGWLLTHSMDRYRKASGTIPSPIPYAPTNNSHSTTTPVEVTPSSPPRPTSGFGFEDIGLELKYFSF